MNGKDYKWLQNDDKKSQALINTNHKRKEAQVLHRINQADTQHKLNLFLKVTGLKSYWIADKCGIPRDVLYAFRSDKRSLPSCQEQRLIAFMEEYQANNAALLYGP